MHAVKLNGGRCVSGVLRGFDPYMNLVLDECVEERSATQKYKIGMVVRTIIMATLPWDTICNFFRWYIFCKLQLLIMSVVQISFTKSDHHTL